VLTMACTVFSKRSHCRGGRWQKVVRSMLSLRCIRACHCYAGKQRFNKSRCTRPSMSVGVTN